MDRNETIKEIRDALKRRSGKTWSVTGGTGTAWGWIQISSQPKHRIEFGYMSEADRAELGQLLGFNTPVHSQGVSIASSSDYYREYMERAKGEPVTKIAQPYWD